MDFKKFGIKIEMLKSSIWERLPVCDRGSVEDAVFIAGSARSGTTWLADILLNYNNNYRLIFEPLHPKYTDRAKILAHKYLRPACENNNFSQAIKAVIAGQIQNKWINRKNRKLFAKKRLIKSIRSNLLLKWIHTNFPFVPIILLLRHPCAVALSRMKCGWKPKIQLLLGQDRLMEDYLSPFLPLVKKQKTEFEDQILFWCIENFVPLCQFMPGEIQIVFYENLCVQPGEELRRAFRFIGNTYSDKVLKAIKKPSVTIHAKSAIISHQDLISGYKRSLTQHDIGKAVTIISNFGLDKIYGNEPMPKIKGADCLEIFNQKKREH